MTVTQRAALAKAQARRKLGKSCADRNIVKTLQKKLENSNKIREAL